MRPSLLIALLLGLIGFAILVGCSARTTATSASTSDADAATPNADATSATAPATAAHSEDSPMPAAKPAGTNAAFAVLGNGCFWCTEAVFERLKGVSSVESGYAGGAGTNPTYEAVCTGRTGHAEVVKITYDPAILAFPDLLDVFFATHDPTTLNRQGNDVGTQYRSVIFAQDEAQRVAAEAKIAALTAAGAFPKPIVTVVDEAATFYPAELYHQDFFARNPDQPYCLATIPQKLAKLEKLFKDKVDPTK